LTAILTAKKVRLRFIFRVYCDVSIVFVTNTINKVLITILQDDTMDHDEAVKFIELVQKCPILYNKRSGGYKRADVKMKKWQ
jgi:hypothetical protein